MSGVDELIELDAMTTFTIHIIHDVATMQAEQREVVENEQRNYISEFNDLCTVAEKSLFSSIWTVETLSYCILLSLFSSHSLKRKRGISVFSALHANFICICHLLGRFSTVQPAVLVKLDPPGQMTRATKIYCFIPAFDICIDF